MTSPIRPFILREGVWYSALSDYLDRYPVPSASTAHDIDYTWPPDDYAELDPDYLYND